MLKPKSDPSRTIRARANPMALTATSRDLDPAGPAPEITLTMVLAGVASQPFPRKLGELGVPALPERVAALLAAPEEVPAVDEPAAAGATSPAHVPMLAGNEPPRRDMDGMPRVL